MERPARKACISDDRTLLSNASDDELGASHCLVEVRHVVSQALKLPLELRRSLNGAHDVQLAWSRARQKSISSWLRATSGSPTYTVS